MPSRPSEFNSSIMQITSHTTPSRLTLPAFSKLLDNNTTLQSASEAKALMIEIISCEQFLLSTIKTMSDASSSMLIMRSFKVLILSDEGTAT